MHSPLSILRLGTLVASDVAMSQLYWPRTTLYPPSSLPRPPPGLITKPPTCHRTLTTLTPNSSPLPSEPSDDCRILLLCRPRFRASLSHDKGSYQVFSLGVNSLSLVNRSMA